MAARKETKKQVRERTVAAMRTLWASLDTHLDWATEELTKKQKSTTADNRAFHAKTAVEYAQAILDLAKNL